MRLNNSHSKIIEKDKYCLFNITVLNLANSKNGIVPHLEIEYHMNDSLYEIKTIKLDYDKQSKPLNKYTFLPIDISLAERETKTGWLNFVIPEYMRNRRIHRYVLVFTDATGHSEYISSILLNTVSDEN